MDWTLPTLLMPLVPTAYFAPIAGRYMSVRRLRRETARKRTLVLTYDDGPSPGTTPRLLELLASRGVRATFFMLGRNVARHPELVDLVAAAGHEIGCHSQDHLHAWKSSPWRSVSDQERGYTSLGPWVGRRAPYRPPYGKLNALTWLALLWRRAPYGWWTVDGGDTSTTLPDPGRAAHSVASSGGGVVLLHDLDRSRERNDFVLAATARLLDAAEADGLCVEPLGQFMNWTS